MTPGESGHLGHDEFHPEAKLYLPDGQSPQELISLEANWVLNFPLGQAVHFWVIEFKYFPEVHAVHVSLSFSSQPEAQPRQKT
jgi:hypothetical protein